MFGSSNLVIRSVFEGGEGCDSGGIEDRSSDIGECARLAASTDAGDEDEDEVGSESVELKSASAGGVWDETSAMLGGCLEVQESGEMEDFWTALLFTFGGSKVRTTEKRRIVEMRRYRSYWQPCESRGAVGRFLLEGRLIDRPAKLRRVSVRVRDSTTCNLSSTISRDIYQVFHQKFAL